ncbi:ornithine cyclodeaminase family protein [Ruthenibacterium sp. CLA-JM-H11]|uniref:Ornithine cyclodeaminase family protein n=1 Tax=Ruthenibacterium intestinale TaxID=3133163 RepID=A0ABV1GDX1_9FIRM
MVPEILFLKQEDVIQAGLLDMKKILEATEKTFRLLGEGKVSNPPKVQLRMPEMDADDWDSYCMSMPSYIGGDEDVVGFKWASEAKANPSKGLPYGVDIVVLSDPHTVFPKAILDGTITTAMRTSAAAGVMAKYNARKNSKVAALFGAGVIGRTMIMAMMEVLPGLETIYMVDLDEKKAQALADEFKGTYHVVPCTDAQTALKDADVVVTETTAAKPFLKKEWIKSNATVIQMEAASYEEDVLTGADKIFVDNWAQLSHYNGTLEGKLYHEGRLNQEDVVEMPQMVVENLGRENDDEFIFCGTLGVGSVDILIANMLYKEAQKLGLGTKLTLWDNPLWV